MAADYVVGNHEMAYKQHALPISGTDQKLPQVVFLLFRFEAKGNIGQEEYWIKWSEKKEEK